MDTGMWSYCGHIELHQHFWLLDWIRYFVQFVPISTRKLQRLSFQVLEYELRSHWDAEFVKSQSEDIFQSLFMYPISALYVKFQALAFLVWMWHTIPLHIIWHSSRYKLTISKTRVNLEVPLIYASTLLIVESALWLEIPRAYKLRVQTSHRNSSSFKNFGICLVDPMATLLCRVGDSHLKQHVLDVVVWWSM